MESLTFLLQIFKETAVIWGSTLKQNYFVWFLFWLGCSVCFTAFWTQSFSLIGELSPSFQMLCEEFWGAHMSVKETEKVDNIASTWKIKIQWIYVVVWVLFLIGQQQWHLLCIKLIGRNSYGVHHNLLYNHFMLCKSLPLADLQPLQGLTSYTPPVAM